MKTRLHESFRKLRMMFADPVRQLQGETYLNELRFSQDGYGVVNFDFIRCLREWAKEEANTYLEDVFTFSLAQKLLPELVKLRETRTADGDSFSVQHIGQLIEHLKKISKPKTIDEILAGKDEKGVDN